MRSLAVASWVIAILPGAAMPRGLGHEGQEGAGNKPEELGQVSFSVSCNAAAQGEFNRAMALFHSFWFRPAIASFHKVLELDPGCGMADWGIAFMSMGNPFAWPANPKPMQAAAAAMADAEHAGARTQRERDYIAALGIFFKDWDTTDHRVRAVALQKAMEALAARYPQDELS
jgi:hypothetical protein